MAPENDNIIKLIMTDFDGVILESEQAKSQAFYECFSYFPEYVDTFMQYHRENLAVGRYDKFEYFFNTILKQKYTEERKRWISKRFNDIVLKLVSASPEVPGAFCFLKTYSNMVPIYVVSTTPEEELLKVLKSLNLKKYFQKVFSTPPAKGVILADILKETGLKPEATLYIGDTNGDLEAAQETQIPFIARRNGQVFKGPRVCELDNLLALGHHLIIDERQKSVSLVKNH